MIGTPRSIDNRQSSIPLDYPKDGVGDGRIPGGAGVGGGEGRGVYHSGVGVGYGRYGSLVRPVPVTVTGPELWQERTATSAAATPAASNPKRPRTPRVITGMRRRWCPEAAGRERSAD